MKILLINGSPKVKENASGYLLEDLKEKLPQNADVRHLHLRTRKAVTEEAVADLEWADVWVFSFPLYVDGVPGHLLACLSDLEGCNITKRQRIVCGISNCGFYEGKQAEVSLEILKNWGTRMGASWGMGLGVGGGGGYTNIHHMMIGGFLKAPVMKGLQRMVTYLDGKDGGNLYVSVAIPMFIYRLAAHRNCRQKIKAAGGTAADLGRRL